MMIINHQLSKIEYVYLLQREMDIKYNVFKIGKTTNIKKRLKASDYRRANIYLIRGVINSTEAENDIINTLNTNKNFIKAKLYYSEMEFGSEDYIGDIYEALTIINNICDKYKFDNNINEKENDNLIDNNINEKENDIISDNIFNNTNITKKNDNNLINVDIDVINTLFNNSNIVNNIKNDINIDNINNADNINYNINIDKIINNINNVDNVNHDINIDKINNTNINDINNVDNVNHINDINNINNISNVKIDIETFIKIFKNYDSTSYIIINTNLFNIYYPNLSPKFNIIPINQILKLTEIVYPKLWILKNLKNITINSIKTPYLTQVVKMDKNIYLGINENNIYDPLTINFYKPHKALLDEIKDFQLNGILINPILLKHYKSHGYECYSLINS